MIINFLHVINLRDMDASGSLTLTNSKTKNIVISDTGERIELKLYGSSLIDGQIEFTHNNGVVSISSSTTITGGISGGRLEQPQDMKRVGPIKDGREE